MCRTMRRPKHARRPLVAVLAVCLALVQLGGASAGASEEAGLAQTRAERARKQAELDAARATDRELEARLAQLKGEISRQSAIVDESRRAAQAAEEAIRVAEQRIALTAERLQVQRSLFAARVKAAYKSPESGLVDVLVNAGSLAEAGVRLYGLAKVIENDDRIVARLADLQKDLEEQRAELQAERERAEAARSEAEEQTIRLEEVKASTEATERALNERIEELKAEVEALAREETRIRSLIRARQAAAERELARRNGRGGASSGSGGRVGAPSAKGFVWPVNGTVTSGFGMRWGRLHAGIDIAAPMGTPVRAAASGQVIFAGSAGGYGNLILIAHGDGIVTAYAHLSAIGVGVNHMVERGQTIGAVGSTGHSTGPHLHFEVRVNGQPVDPMAYL